MNNDSDGNSSPNKLLLRGYQEDILNAARNKIRHNKNKILIVAPTGSGKTCLIATMAANISKKGKELLFVVHRVELIKQSSKTFLMAGVEHGIIASGFPSTDHPIQIASIQTLSRRMDDELIMWLKKLDVLILDEAHHVAANSWDKLYKHIGPQAITLGLTATPIRGDKKGLGKYFSDMVLGPDVKELIDMGYLSKFKVFAASSADLSKVHTVAGDYNKKELSQAVLDSTITGDAVREYIKHAPGKQALIFCVDVEHSKKTCELFIGAGFTAAHIDGETRSDIREETLRRFAAGEIKVLTNCELFTEGYDCPGVQVLIQLRPTKSLGLYRQMIGRALRPVFAPGFLLDTVEERLKAQAVGEKPYAIILDHASNCMRHGLPSEKVDWSLDDIRSNKSDSKVKICPKCFAAMERFIKECDECGHRFGGHGEARARVFWTADGELQEISDEQSLEIRRDELKSAKTYDQLVALGVKRKYRYPRQWAEHVLKQRHAWRSKYKPTRNKFYNSGT